MGTAQAIFTGLVLLGGALVAAAVFRVFFGGVYTRGRFFTGVTLASVGLIGDGLRLLLAEGAPGLWSLGFGIVTPIMARMLDRTFADRGVRRR